MSQEQATLNLPGKDPIELGVITGVENEQAIDITKLRAQTGYVTLDDGYGNTGSCTSGITFIDGEKGILRYRGMPIEQLAEQSTFAEVAWLLLFGELPTKDELAGWSAKLTEHAGLHNQLTNAYSAFPQNAHPMAILSSMIQACSCYHPELLEDEIDDESFMDHAAKLMSKVRTMAAFAYKHEIGQPIRHPKPDLDYSSNFLHMMFSTPYSGYEPDPEVVKALNQILILHADHEQNCSTSTVRMVASSAANLFASCAAGVCALWGWKHGGANVAVLEMLQTIHDQKMSVKDYVEKVKTKEVKLMGFGHRVYKNFDPRAKILGQAADVILPKLGVKDPLLDLARELADVALEDSYFVDRKLYPNVDFYSGIILRAMGIPLNMFTVMFAIGRMPGWMAHWRELRKDGSGRINRPRQIYTGSTARDYVPMEKR